MKAVILAGGMGTRLREETEFRPKPLVEIGGRPILWHIMKTLSSQGINDFVICLGYKGIAIKEYFANYFLHKSDVTIDLKNSSDISKLELYDLSGKEYQISFQLNCSLSNIELDLTNLAEGTYHYVISLHNGTKANGKIIVL